MFVYLVFGLTILLFLHCYFKYNRTTRLLRKIPTIEENFIIGNALSVLLSPVELFKKAREWATKYEPMYFFWAPFINVISIYTPDNIETVISSMKHNEKSLAYTVIKPWLREGLLLSQGAKWQHRRKILTPAFHFHILKRFFTIIEEHSQKLVKYIEKLPSEPIDVIPVISEYTLHGICETSMGTQLNEKALTSGKIYKDAIYKLAPLCVDRLTKLYLLSDFTFNLSSLGKNTMKQLGIVKAFTAKVIDERKKYIEENGIKLPEENDVMDDDTYYSKKKERIAMLDLLLTAQKEGSIDDLGIQEEVDTFMFEGHDTTASGLIYCLMLLANHKSIQDKIVEELKQIYGDSDRLATIEDLSSMKYLECCIKESLRLYPPVPFIGRRISEEITLNDYTIPAGTYCHIHIFDLHRRKDLYEDPLVYNPDRFLPENSAKRHPYAYIPFSAGPRNCIGQRFAMMEMKSCVAAILRKYELHPVTAPDDIEFTSDLVLRCTKPVYVKFVKRDSVVSVQ